MKGQADGGSFPMMGWLVIGAIFLLVLLYVIYTSTTDASNSVLDKLFGWRK